MIFSEKARVGEVDHFLNYKPGTRGRSFHGAHDKKEKIFRHTHTSGEIHTSLV